MKIQRINATPRWSDVVIYNHTAWFVEVPEDTSVDMAAQTAQVLRQAESRLIEIGSDKSRLLSVTIYVTDTDQLAAMNAAWEAWLPENCAPSRACIKAALVNPSMQVEMAFVAALAEV